ncbi:TetR family transcriptional regulator [Thermodesulfobacteriota bacterium]
MTKKKKAVLKAAEYLFATKDFTHTTVADIAQESGVHEASIYSYFNNKRNILFAIYGGYLRLAFKTLNKHFLGMKEPGPKLRKTFWHYLNDMKANPNYSMILMMAQRENPDFYTSEESSHLKNYTRLALSIIIEGQEEGLFRKDLNPRLIRNMGMGTCAFAVFDSIAHNRPYDPHEQSDIIYQLVVNGTRPIDNEHGMLREGPKKDRAKLRRAQILKTSTRVFANKSFSNATISEIAKQANLGDATLYEYFDSKEAILLGISDIYLQDLSSDKDIIFKDVPETERALRKLIWKWIWQVWTQPDFSRVLFLELFRNINFYSSRGYRFFEVFLEKIRNVVKQGQNEGVFIPDVPFSTYLNMIIGTLDQYMLSEFLLGRPSPGIAELNDIVDSLVWAIKNR